MLKLTVLLLAAVSNGASGYLIKFPTPSWTPKTGPIPQQDWVFIQKLVMPLFENVCEDSTDSVIINLSNNFERDFRNENFLNPEIITYVQNYKTGKKFLPKGEIFTEYNNAHIEELKVIFNLLYFAKDFDTFYKAAAWARQNINCGLYVDAIYLAMLYRKDTEKLSIPPPYELLPNYFIKKDVIIKSSLLLANEEFIETENVRVQGNSYILDANYSKGIYEYNVDPLTYFHEDIGLNSFYFLQKLKMSPWLKYSVGLRPKYGERIYHTMKQFMTRYNLERFSNGLPELDDLKWNFSSMIPYDPMLIYSNGKDFDLSSSLISLDNEDVTLLQNIENNIIAVADHMRANRYSKNEILNHLMEILVTNDNSYENIAFKIFGNITSEQKLPSVLAHYLTTVRDPLFWKINKKIVDLVDGALDILPGYTRNDLIFPGVEIINVDIKKMSTSFDYFEFDVTDALKTITSYTKFQVNIGQYRLSHKPFSLKLNISSLVTQKGFAKIFIGPKVWPGEFSEKKHLYFLLDCFEINLKKGKNIITRTSNQMKLSEDLTSLKIVRKILADAEFGINALPLKMLEAQIGFPQRLLLPKGTENGLPLQIFVFVAPYIKPAISARMANTEYNIDTVLTAGYPLDLNSDIVQLLDLPNAITKDIIITHKDENKPINEVSYDTANIGKEWTSDEIERPVRLLKSSARPDFTMRKEPFDYKSKRGQYGKKDDYFAKRGNYSKGKPDIFEAPMVGNNTEISDKEAEKSDMKKEIDKDLNNDINELNKNINDLISDKIVFEQTIKKTQEVNDSQEKIISEHKNKISNNVKPPLLRQRNPTVYDFLLTILLTNMILSSKKSMNEL